MKIKTSELSGAALDWAVATCTPNSKPIISVHKNSKGATVYFSEGLYNAGIPYRPSTDWCQGGPIIEQNNISVLRYCGEWAAQISGSPMHYADTHLVAAMRCYVASKLGDEVEIPEELT